MCDPSCSARTGTRSFEMPLLVTKLAGTAYLIGMALAFNGDRVAQ
jgi:hypothetical protein